LIRQPNSAKASVPNERCQIAPHKPTRPHTIPNTISPTYATAVAPVNSELNTGKNDTAIMPTGASAEHWAASCDNDRWPVAGASSARGRGVA
jgi:hypothetical protein